MSAPAQDGSLAAELWVSFASLMRSYAAAASLNLGTPAAVATEAGSLRAEAGSALLEIRFDAQSAAGSWRLSGHEPEKSGTLQLTPAGTMLLDGRNIDLDHAAIDFAAALMQAAAQPAGTEL